MSLAAMKKQNSLDHYESRSGESAPQEKKNMLMSDRNLRWISQWLCCHSPARTEGEDLLWVKLLNHAFQGPTGHGILKTLTTLANSDPVSEYNSNLEQYRVRKELLVVRRKLSYYSNIYVV